MKLKFTMYKYCFICTTVSSPNLLNPSSAPGVSPDDPSPELVGMSARKSSKLIPPVAVVVPAAVVAGEDLSLLTVAVH